MKGITVHLPLPIKETLQKICPDTDPLNINHEMYILVRSHPTKGKKIWEDYVDIKKVWKALSWLKEKNELYSKIVLPFSPDDLFQKLKDSDLEYNDDGTLVEPEIKDAPAALLTLKEQSDEFYDEYTIYPLHNQKVYETDTKLYQMKKVMAEPVPSRTKNLDLMCFPDLYPYGKYGQHHERSRKLRDYDYIRSRLSSAHPQFRLNKQFLFFLLQDHTIRALNGGIYHLLNVVNPKVEYTAGNFRQQIEENLIDSNINSVFERIRGTEAFWKIPRNDLNCMANEYGPCTFFVTLSPGEWMWPELGDYIKKVNGWSNDKRSISELVAADPVSATTFIHNRFDAVMAYLLSDDNPIGKIIHYYCI